jgi:hypothetical protein
VKPVLRTVSEAYRGWPALQKFILKDLIAVSKNINGIVDMEKMFRVLLLLLVMH